MRWSYIWPLIATALSFMIGGILIAAFGHDPFSAFAALIYGAFGNTYAVATTLTNSLPLMLTGLAVALSFKSGLFNIGASGQYWLGAIAAAWVGYGLSLPAVIHIPLAMLAGMVAGGLWGAIIPGLAKAYRGAHEVITTLMLTYIAIDFGHYLVEGGPMQAPGYTPQSPQLHATAIIPNLVHGTQLSWAIFLAPLMAVLVWFLLQRTAVGFTLRMAGLNLKATRYAGVNPALAIILALGISGAIAGFAGAVQVMGVDHRLFDAFNPAYGFTGIVVALLARNDPFGTLLAALLFGALASGASTMQIDAGVPFHLVDVIQGLIIFFIASEGLLRYFSHKRAAKLQQTEGA